MKKLAKKGEKTNPPKPTVVPIAPETTQATPFDTLSDPKYDSVERMPPPAAATSPAEPVKRKAGRPPGPGSSTPRFWDEVQAIPADMWGESGRTYIYVYLVEPLCDLKTEGRPGYLMKYYEPVDPDMIMKRWGSGRYYLMLKQKQPGQKQDKMVDEYTFEIYNPEFPTKIPRELWKRDARNARWEQLQPKEKEKPDPNAAPDPAKMFGTFLDIQDRMAERMEPQGNSVLDTAVKLIELTKPKEPAAPTAAPDPWAAAERILNMRSENPMVNILQEELKALRLQMDKRDERMTAMQGELFDAKLAALKASMQPQTQHSKGILEQATELAKAFGMEPGDLLKRFVGAEDGPIKSKMTGWMQLIKELADTPLVPAITPLLNSLATLLQPKPPQGQQPVAQQTPPTPNNRPATPHAVGTFEELIDWVDQSLTNPMLDYLGNGNSGDVFAEWVHNGWPENAALKQPDRLKQVQEITHPMMPGQKGAFVIVELFKRHACWQTHLAPREAQFRKFVEEFCAWRPKDEADEPAAAPKSNSDSSDESSKGDF